MEALDGAHEAVLRAMIITSGCRLCVIGYSLRVDKFIGNVEKCGDS
jgi:hypothetical protein